MMGCIYSSEITKNKQDIINIGSPNSPMNEDPISPGYTTPEVNGQNKENSKPNLRIRIPSDDKSKMIIYTRKKYIDEDTESYCLFSKC
jgi:hypothetical protein